MIIWGEFLGNKLELIFVFDISFCLVELLFMYFVYILIRYSKMMGYFVELLKGVGYLKKFCFKFGLKVYNWLLFFNMEVLLNFVLKLKIESRWKFIEK